MRVSAEPVIYFLVDVCGLPTDYEAAFRGGEIGCCVLTHFDIWASYRRVCSAERSGNVHDASLADQCSPTGDFMSSGRGIVTIEWIHDVSLADRCLTITRNKYTSHYQNF